MKTRSCNRSALLTFGVLLAGLSLACILWVRKEQRQYAMNRQLIEALKTADIKQAIALVEVGADPNTCIEPTPAPSLPELVSRLLQRSQPPAGETALIFACEMESSTTIGNSDAVAFSEANLPLLRAMLAHGANVHAKIPDGSTALHLAVKLDRQHTVELLLQHGADINVQDERGNSPLNLSTLNDTANTAHLLLSHGANPNVQNEDGFTALHEVLYSPIAKTLIPDLLAHGADPNLRTKYEFTPLQCAQQGKLPDIVALMRKYRKRP